MAIDGKAEFSSIVTPTLDPAAEVGQSLDEGQIRGLIISGFTDLRYISTATLPSLGPQLITTTRGLLSHQCLAIIFHIAVEDYCIVSVMYPPFRRCG